MPPPIEPLATYCRQWREALARTDGPERRMAVMRDRLPEFLLDRRATASILEAIAAGRPYPEVRHATAFENEIRLHTDPGNRFSVYLHVYGPGDRTPVHDHSAWGVIGTPGGTLEVVEYRRVAAAGDRVVETGRRLLKPGDVAVTLPLDDGIHATGNPTDAPIVMISIYGKPMRRLYVNGFNPEDGTSYRMYPPRMQKKMLAKSALDALRRSDRA